MLVLNTEKKNNWGKRHMKCVCVCVLKLLFIYFTCFLSASPTKLYALHRTSVLFTGVNPMLSSA